MMSFRTSLHITAIPYPNRRKFLSIYFDLKCHQVLSFISLRTIGLAGVTFIQNKPYWHLLFTHCAGGTFALYSLLCRHAKLSTLPNQQPADEKLSAYATKDSADTWQSALLKSFFEKHPRFRKVLLIFVLLGTCMTIGDGVITPAISGSWSGSSPRASIMMFTSWLL